MSENRPFDAAISWLRVPVGLSDEQKDATIRVLEAAGKVDIRSAQFFIDGAANFGEGLSAINSDSSRYLYQTGEKQARALLESLPEKEGK